LFALISLGSVFCGATTVSASDWVYVGTDVNASITYIDIDSLKKDASFVTAWVKTDSSKDKSAPEYESLRQIKYDCSNHTLNTLYVINRFRNKPQETLNFYSLQYTGGSPVVPDSIGDVELKFVCS
jgi:hypothetical protein